MSSKKKDKKEKYSIEDIKLIYEFKFNAVKESALGLSKGMGFYLAIMAVLLGYILTQESDAQIRFFALGIGLITSILGFIACATIGWGIIKGLNSIKEVLNYNNSVLFSELNVEDFFNRGKKAVKTTLICAGLILIVFSISMVTVDFDNGRSDDKTELNK